MTDNGALSFDPYAPGNKDSGDKNGKKNNDLLGDYDNIEIGTQNLNADKHISGSSKLAPSDSIKGLDLSDFDPLSNEEIEEGIKTEKILSRSRNVVSNRSIGNSRVEKKLSASNSAQVQSQVEHVEPLMSQNDVFDVVDKTEVNSSDYNDSYSKFYQSDHRTSTRGRENFIKLHLAAREKEFTELHPFSIFVGTWNVNGQYPNESLSPWLQSAKEPPDVFAIGFQELDLSAEALVFNDSSREDSWVKSIENSLPKNVEYFQVKLVRLVGMMLVVYVQSKHKMQVTNVESETNGTGIMGMMGNKGGVGIRFQLHNSTICFVNSHLAAHLMEFERRNQDFREVYSNLKFTLFQPPLSIADHNMVFWLGDLNYRFDELSVEEVKRLDEEANYKTLQSYDQLIRQKNLGKTFKGFTEGPLLFKPTYKFDPGTDDWDTSEKSRAPAWCDRVLWKGKDIQQQCYRCHPELKLSDHKPVSSVFKVGIKIVDCTRERKVFEDIVRKLDKEENDSLPQVKLEKYEIELGEVHFMEKKFGMLPILNIGQRIVEFEFIPKLDEKEVSKPWFKVNPVAGIIMAGDFIEIEITLCVNKESAPHITKAKYQLGDILVLHLVNGKDFFVQLNATYKPSVFGSSLETLVRTFGPINDVPIESITQLEALVASDGGAFPESIDPLEIPKELWLLMDHLYKYGSTKENILLQSGIDEEIMEIRNYLDSGQEGKIPGSIYSIGEALLLLLESLPEPVIPSSYYSKCIEACNNYILCKQAINLLPSTHYKVFLYLCSYLQYLLKNSAENKLDAKMLAAVFGSILLRSPINETEKTNKRMLSQLAQKKARFVYHFLVNDFRS